MASPLDIAPASSLRFAERPDPLREKAQELEGLFLNTLVSQMFKGLETDGMFGGGHAEETWRGMMAEHYADAMARAGGIGLADQIVAALIQIQEAGFSTSPAAAGALPVSTDPEQGL